MAGKVFVAAMLLGCFLVSASAHRHLMQEPTEPTAAGTDPAIAGDDEFRVDPTPGPIDADPSQMGRRNGFYRCGKSCMVVNSLYGIVQHAVPCSALARG
jgi:hypothetical protein